MTIPPHDEDPWSQGLRSTDPRHLPPGFYFPPGTGPHSVPPRRGGAGKWIMVVAVLLVFAIGVGLTLFLT